MDFKNKFNWFYGLFFFIIVGGDDERVLNDGKDIEMLECVWLIEKKLVWIMMRSWVDGVSSEEELIVGGKYWDDSYLRMKIVCEFGNW